MKTEKFITCECHGHGIMTDYIKEENLNEFLITSFGDKGYFEKPNLWQRIKAALKTLRTGWFPGGEVCLSRENAMVLKTQLNRFLK